MRFSAIRVFAPLGLALMFHCSDDPAATTTDASTQNDASVGNDASVSDGAVSDAGSDASTCTYDETSDGTAKVLAIYTMAPQSLIKFNPGLTQKDLDDSLTKGINTTDQPAPGSGLDYLGGCPGKFAMVTDRGPNGDYGDSKFFPLPKFTPTIAEVSLVGTEIRVDKAIPILRTDGVPVTGISNTANDDTPYSLPDGGPVLPYDQNGLDTEEIRKLPNGNYLIAEEYSPSLVVVDGATGKVLVRYMPQGLTLPDAKYPVKAILPAVIANRRANKGLEGLSLSPDGKTAFAVMQTPLGPKANDASLLNRVIRIEDPGDPDKAKVTGHFVVNHGLVGDFGSGKQTAVYYNAAAYLSPNKLLLLERIDGRTKLVAADFTAATNLFGTDGGAENTSDIERADGGGGVTPATTTIVYDSNDTPTFITTPPNNAVSPAKIEGLAVINKTTVAITNDTDFGVPNVADRTRIWVIRLKAPLPL